MTQFVGHHRADFLFTEQIQQPGIHHHTGVIFPQGIAINGGVLGHKQGRFWSYIQALYTVSEDLVQGAVLLRPHLDGIAHQRDILGTFVDKFHKLAGHHIKTRDAAEGGFRLLIKGVAKGIAGNSRIGRHGQHQRQRRWIPQHRQGFRL